jgi:hypothetical protein
MKNCFLLIALVLTSTHLFSQSALPAGKPEKTGNEWKMPGDAITRAQSFTNYLKKNLDLDDATSQKVFRTYLDNTKSVDEIPQLPISDDEKKERLKTNKLVFNEKLRGILSADQYNKYIKIDSGKKKL